MGHCFLLQEARCCGPTKGEAEVYMREARQSLGCPGREAGGLRPWDSPSGRSTVAAPLRSDLRQIIPPGLRPWAELRGSNNESNCLTRAHDAHDDPIAKSDRRHIGAPPVTLGLLRSHGCRRPLIYIARPRSATTARWSTRIDGQTILRCGTVPKAVCTKCGMIGWICGRIGARDHNRKPDRAQWSP
jgi:hypothetical protein